MEEYVVSIVPNKKNKNQPDYMAEIYSWGGIFEEFERDFSELYRRNDCNIVAIGLQDVLSAYTSPYLIAYAVATVQTNSKTGNVRCQVARLGVNPHHKEYETIKRLFNVIMSNQNNILGNVNPKEFSLLVDKENQPLLKALADLKFKMTDYQDYYYAEKYVEKEIQKGD